VADIITLRAKPLKLAGPGFVAERNVSRMSRLNWLRLRKTGLGGTDSSALIYPDDYAGPLTVYFDKLSPVVEEAQEANDYLDYGRIMEESLRNTFLPTYLVRHGVPVSAFTIYTSPYFYRSTELPWLTCNIDGMIEFHRDVTLDGGPFIPAGMYVLELKTADISKRDDWKDGSTPDRYFTQAHHYVRGLTAPGAIIFALVNRAPQFRFLPRHEEFQALIEKTGTEAWRQIQEHDPPAAFGGDSDLSVVRKLYPVGGETAKSFPGLEAHVLELIEARERKSYADTDIKRLEAFFKSEIGDASGLVDGETGVKWTRWVSKNGSAGNRLTVKVKGREEE